MSGSSAVVLDYEEVGVEAIDLRLDPRLGLEWLVGRGYQA